MRSQKRSIQAGRIAESRPGPAKSGSCQGTEEAVPVAANALNVGQIGPSLLDCIDIIRLKEIELGIRINNGGRIETVREIGKRSRTAIEVSVVAAEEEID